MSNKKQQMTRLSDREFQISRLFSAPRKLVWQAWSDCEHLKHWWGPTGWTLSFCKIDFKAGGIWHYCMKGPGPDGKEMESWGRTVFREIVEPQRIVSVDAFSDAEGNVVGSLPEMVITITFEEVERQTRVTSRTEFASAADLDTVIKMGMEEGLAQTWDRLSEHLASMQN